MRGMSVALSFEVQMRSPRAVFGSASARAVFMILLTYALALARVKVKKGEALCEYLADAGEAVAHGLPSFARAFQRS
jgi:hypothetical protein